MFLVTLMMGFVHAEVYNTLMPGRRFHFSTLRLADQFFSVGTVLRK